MTRRAIRRYRFISFTIFLPFQLVWLRCRINKYIYEKEVPLQFNVNESDNTLTISKICETRLEILNKKYHVGVYSKEIVLRDKLWHWLFSENNGTSNQNDYHAFKSQEDRQSDGRTLDSKSLGSRFKFSHCLVDFPILMTL